MGRKAKLNEIVICCERRFNRGLSTDWKHSDFNDLNREILRDTYVNISPNTLKRIFGKISVDDDYLPQQATIDALKKYGGYIELESEPIVQPEEATDGNVTAIFSKHKLLFGISICAIILLLVGLLIVKKYTTNHNTQSSIKLTTTEGLLPATAFFNVQLPVTDDSVFIDFGDKSPLVFLALTQQKIAHNYLFPSVFDVKLLTRQHIVASTKVYVASNKWIGLGYHRQRDLPDHYYAFPALKTGNDSLFYIENNQLSKMGLDTAGSFFTRLCNFSATGYSSDNFVFETSFKNDLISKGIYCHGTQFKVAGTNGVIRFHLVNSGCSSKVLNILSEQTFEGSTSNLSQFVVDLDKWNAIKIINKNRQVQLYVNGILLFSGIYKQPLGEIKGVFVEFEGNGFVKQCDLKTGEGKTLYHF